VTFSIVARCPRTGQFGIGAATGVPAVGKLLTHAAAGVGAVATQAKLNPYIGIDGVADLASGLRAGEVRARRLAADPEPAVRQFAVIDRHGETAVFTGAECIPWAGSREGPGYSVQGNRLTGPDVLAEVEAGFLAAPEASLDQRLLAALAAGDAVGGDRKEEISATIYVVDREAYQPWDIRVDEHPDPIVELSRLHRIFRERLLPEIEAMPKRPAGDAAERSGAVWPGATGP
jgi:uncharacterized Ntn-hydrolase superfamily protein